MRRALLQDRRTDAQATARRSWSVNPQSGRMYDAQVPHIKNAKSIVPAAPGAPLAIVSA